MTKPKIADTKPKQVNLDAGEHYWCACGLSNAQPLCDGSHAGSGFSPKAFSVEEPGGPGNAVFLILRWLGLMED